MTKTKIEWATDVWNPVVGCTNVSPGCDNCYAIPQSRRNEAMGVAAYEGLTRKIEPRFAGDVDEQRRGSEWTGVVRCLPERLGAPSKWVRPRRVFVNSMSDLFHPDVPDEFIADVFATMALARAHTFQVLTKRPQRMAKLLADRDFVIRVDDLRGADAGDFDWPLPNVWLGTSVEDQRYADLRIPYLLRTPAAVRFLSIEPLLGPVELTHSSIDYLRGWCTAAEHSPECNGRPSCEVTCPIPVQTQTQRIDWVIVGGESGPGARPMHPSWPRTLRDQCVAAGVPFFFKQWGEWAPYAPEQRPLGNGALVEPDGSWHWLFEGEPSTLAELCRRTGKREAGRVLDGRTWDEFPVLNKAAVA